MDTQVEHYKACFTSEECKVYFTQLNTEIPWQYVKWRTGRNLPRRIYKPTTIGIPPVLFNLRKEVEDMLECRVLNIWCNHYNSGLEYTPPHQDQYGAHVVTVSFGATRRCVTENILTNQKVEYLLEDGDIFYFSPEYDAHHRHSIPKTTTKGVGPRISIVFFTTEPFTNTIVPVIPSESNNSSRSVIRYEESEATSNYDSVEKQTWDALLKPLLSLSNITRPDQLDDANINAKMQTFLEAMEKMTGLKMT